MDEFISDKEIKQYKRDLLEDAMLREPIIEELVLTPEDTEEVDREIAMEEVVWVCCNCNAKFDRKYKQTSICRECKQKHTLKRRKKDD